MSCKHSRWDRRWLISSVRVEKLNIDDQKGRRKRENGKFVRDEKQLLFHTPKSRITPSLSVSAPCYQTQTTESISPISGVDVCGRVPALSQVFVTGGADKMQMTSHALHIPGMICAFQSVCHQWKFVFLRMSQSCQGQIKQAFMKLGRLCSGEVVVIPLKTERRRVCSNPSVCNGLVSSPCWALWCYCKVATRF